jgi:lipoate-protein ligase B
MGSFHAQVVSGLFPGVIMLTRHDSCITTGLVGSYQESWIRTDRGGGPTYHDSGQLICYPVIRLDSFGIKVSEYNSLIYSWIYDAILSVLREKGRTREKLEIVENGIWLDKKKIAFIGTRIKAGISLHGFAINLFSDLRKFKPFNPCDRAGLIVGNLMETPQEVVRSLLESSPFR